MILAFLGGVALGVTATLSALLLWAMLAVAGRGR